MPFWLDDDMPVFPGPMSADDDVLLAVGGRVSPEFLRAAYRQGIFPWFDPEVQPPLWWFPDPRPVFYPGKVKVSKSMRQWFRRHTDYRFTVNRAFEQVLHYCAEIPGRGGEGAWFSQELRQSVLTLFRTGEASSVEVWNAGGKLVGGLYGITVADGVFSGESMFHLEPDTSKAALIYLVQNAVNWGYEIIDGQVVSEHLMRMGAELISAKEFYERFILKHK
jgi:leucyl/phenylalanyl-tRNA--protein transferase